jgi:hypothetical protein
LHRENVTEQGRLTAAERAGDECDGSARSHLKI